MFTGPYCLLRGDCRQLLATLPVASVDAIVTDPPYDQTNEDYDLAVPLAVWEECFRVARPGAALLSLSGNPTYHRLASNVERAGWTVKQMWAWIYRDGFITSAYPKEGFDRLAPAFDPICFATKGKCLLSVQREGDQSWDRFTGRKNPYDELALSKRSGRQRARQGTGHYPRALVTTEGIEGFQYFLAPRASSTRGERVGHPNQKPLSLFLWLLGKVPGTIILDPFMGSATTGLAAILDGRQFIGMEKDPAYFAMADQRLREALHPGG
jgi:DNA modification methylase